MSKNTAETKKLIKCREDKTDCFAYRRGDRGILVECFDYACPFYKSMEKHEADVEAARRRVEEVWLGNGK